MSDIQLAAVEVRCTMPNRTKNDKKMRERERERENESAASSINILQHVQELSTAEETVGTESLWVQ